MPSAPQPDRLLVERIRSGEREAWNELIARFEGRLLAFVDARLRNRAASEDVVQESLVGFLTSLPNYDLARPLEGYLFSIAAHKLTDYLRREGRRPTLPLVGGTSSDPWEPAARQRRASSAARSGERRGLEEQALVRAMQQIFDGWRTRGDWDKLACVELLIVRGLPNKDVAAQLGISEQTVANQKFDFLGRLRSALRQQRLSADVFPELAEA
jgi:RNA polymerase sigma-70 factor, ECF subfamily